jgi:outer membrane protein OmpA-like peptidoglycan-associated protein
MSHGTRLGVLATVLSVVSTGCATVEWTESLFAKQRVEVDARFAKVETGVREHGERIDRVEVRVASLDGRLSETRDLVRTALPQTPTAVPARPVPAEPRPSVAAPERVAPDRSARGRTLIGVVHVPFGFDRADLEPGAEAALSTIVKELREHPNMTIDLEGTTDPVGRLDYNLRLSQRRVEAVARWLTAKGVDRARIVGAKGRGPVPNTTVKDDVKRRVMVKLLTSGE